MTTPNDHASRSESKAGAGRARVGAVLHTNIFSIRGFVRRLRGNRELWPDTIDAAQLPSEVRSAITDIVGRTRLWNSERIEVARELCSHAAEALEAGRSPGEIAKTLGDPKTVARLIRRSMKRKRPLAWQIRAWTVRGLGAAAGVVLLIAGFMTARFFIGSPTITRNFIAELNAPIEALDEDEKAWPLLKEAWSTLGSANSLGVENMHRRVENHLQSVTFDDEVDPLLSKTGVELLPIVPSDHPDADDVRAIYNQILPELELLRKAASKPSMGLIFTSKWTELPEVLYNTPEARGWLPDPIPESDDPADQEWVVGVLLPALGPQRIATKWLGYDALVKIAEGDAAGALDSIDAMMGFADQVAEDHFLIGYLVGIAIEHLAINTVSEMLVEHRNTLANEDLVRLAHLFGAPRFEQIPLEGEEMMFADFLQRTFTDDGNGDGYLTNEGVELLASMQWFNTQYGTTFGEAAREISTIALVASRAEQQRMADRIYAQLRVQEAAGYGIYRDTPLASDVMVESLDPIRYRPLRIMLPALGKVTVTKQERRARVEACLVGIASELYRRETGAWPASVVDLHPRYLPFIPEDPATGDPIAITPGDTTIIVYALGQDGDDDGGVMDPADERMMRPRPVTTFVEQPSGRFLIAPLPIPNPDADDGDWVLFPAFTP
jgi:hypothetical protein